MRLDLIPDQRFERFFLAREIDIVTKVRWKFCGSNSFWIIQLKISFLTSQNFYLIKVNHPNVAKVYECFSIGPSTIILSELYECDLLQYVQVKVEFLNWKKTKKTLGQRSY